MGGGLAFLVFPMVLGLPVACVGLVLRLCEWSWHKPSGSMGSTRILAGYGTVCALNLLVLGLIAIVAARTNG
jgi:hypothetical protein